MVAIGWRVLYIVSADLVKVGAPSGVGLIMFKVIEGWGDFESPSECDGFELVAEFADESKAQAFSESYYESQIAPDSDGFSMVNWQSYFVIVRGA